MVLCVDPVSGNQQCLRTVSSPFRKSRIAFVVEVKEAARRIPTVAAFPSALPLSRLVLVRDDPEGN